MKRRLRIARIIIYKETLVDTKDHILTFIGSFCGIALIGWLNSLKLSLHDNLFLIGSFGASSVLLFGVSNSPLAQPRNLIGGHVISAFIGVSMHMLFPDIPWLSSALSVSLSIVFMQITKTLHPPGGAAALIANIGSQKVKELGFLYILSPILTGTLILLAIALVVNNISRKRSYPRNKNWYKIWLRRYR